MPFKMDQFPCLYYQRQALDVSVKVKEKGEVCFLEKEKVVKLTSVIGNKVEGCSVWFMKIK